MTNFLLRAVGVATYVGIRSYIESDRPQGGGANNRENEGDHILDNGNGPEEEEKQDGQTEELPEIESFVCPITQETIR